MKYQILLTSQMLQQFSTARLPDNRNHDYNHKKLTTKPQDNTSKGYSQVNTLERQNRQWYNN